VGRNQGFADKEPPQNMSTYQAGFSSERWERTKILFQNRERPGVNVGFLRKITFKVFRKRKMLGKGQV
jgi:hypothetical protein